MKLPGSEHLSVLAAIFAEIDWANLRPAQELLQRQPGDADVIDWISVARAGSQLVAYTPGAPIELNSALDAAEWRSPRTGERARADRTNLRPPSDEDWVLLGRVR
jgi:hypothetical protein